ncbi:MAG: flagellar hook-length control protein FliK, partial [Actinomycetota bacterium]|nr:flagellar hook-length control protein FliK [Actinomycetota bacterium]
GAGSHSGNSGNGSHGEAGRTVSSRDASTVRTDFAPLATAPSLAPPTLPASQPLAGQPIVAHQPSIEPVSAPAATLPNVPTHDYPAVAQPMTQQLAGPVLGLRAGGDASRQLSIALHPADLGAVSVHVRITGDAMTIQLASVSESAHAAIREALPQLRQELQSAGLSSVEVSLDLATGNSGGQADPRQADRSSGHSGAAPPPIELPVRPAAQLRSAGPGNTGLDRWL